MNNESENMLIHQLKGASLYKPQLIFDNGEYKIFNKLLDYKQVKDYFEVKEEIKSRLFNSKAVSYEKEIVKNHLRNDFELYSAYDISELANILMHVSSN